MVKDRGTTYLSPCPFWSTAKAWGIYRQSRDPETGAAVWEIEALYGSLEGIKVN